jgi:tRNA threonylcarbamoyladenosine biosynthesis protein TsaB
MRVLALDTATEACSVALLAEQGLIGRYAEPGRGHAAQILGMVDAVLAQAGMSLSMLDGIAASVGPGAFTGVRISVSAAQGLAFGAGLNLVGVSTLEALALRALDAGADIALACLDARMGEVYWGCYAADTLRGVRAIAPPRVGAPGSVHLPAARARSARVGGIGRGFAAYPELGRLPGLSVEPADAGALPNAREMARLGALRLRAGEGADPADLEPLYLRDKVALTEAERGVKST